MAASTVGYTDTTGNRDYLGMIASQIGRRLKEASNMASEERAYAEGQAEKGGTSLSEAGIGKGYFFRRALGSRFGGDRIARTKGRMGIGGAGTDPTGNFKSRFRGGFDYNVTNELSSIPLSNALTAGLRGVESGLIDISQSLNSLARGMNDLARAQGDAARQAILNGAFMQAFLNFMQREASRQGARSEERGLERRGGFGVGGGGRGMINVTPSGGGTKGGILGGFNNSALSTFTSLGTSKGVAKGASKIPAAVKALNKTAASGFVGALTKGATSEEIVSTAGKMITGDIISDPLAKSIDDMIPGMGAVSGIFTGDSLRGANLPPTTDFMYADMLAKAQMDMSPEGAKLLDDLIGGNLGNKTIKQKEAVELLEFIKKGGYTGGPLGTDEALAIMKQGMGEQQYGKLMGGVLSGADKPIAKQLGGTVAEQTIKQGLKLKAKAGAKSLVKKLPLIGAIAGVAFGIQRALEGDFLGAGLEITSGMLGMAPGLGSGIGLGIDGFLLARDLNAMPMADGGLLTKPTRVVAGEAGLEGFFPLEGARGKKTFKMFGEGNLQARMDNESDDSKLLALGHKRYYEQMGGWKSFGTGLLDAFSDMKDKVGDTLANVNPFSAENLSKVNNSSAANSIRNVIGSEVGDGYLGPKWLGIKNPFADEQANMLNNTSADTSLGQMMMSTTVINNNYAVANSGNGGEGSSDSSFPSTFTAFTVPYSLASK